MDQIRYDLLEQSVSLVRSHWPDCNPRCGIVFGSGWGPGVEPFEITDRISYEDIPALGQISVPGHKGILSLAELGVKQLLLFEGRFHSFENCGWTAIAFPVYLLKSLQVPVIILLNAAGGIHPDYHPGDLMVIDDHLNLTGLNPLTGSENLFWGTRFVDLSQAYDKSLRTTFLDLASSQGLKVHSGVYCAVGGPSYETPAETRMLDNLGADAVGMSTVFTTILSRAVDLRVLGVSCISNKASGLSDSALSHEEVQVITGKSSKQAAKVLAALIASNEIS